MVMTDHDVQKIPEKTEFMHKLEYDKKMSIKINFRKHGTLLKLLTLSILIESRKLEKNRLGQNERYCNPA